MPPTPGRGTILEALKDSDPNLKAQPDSPQELLRKAEEPASELSVEEAIRVHSQSCPTTRRVRKWQMIVAVLLGMLLATQALIVVAGRAVLQETVRQAVREELGHSTMASAPPVRWIKEAHAETKGAP